MYKKVIIQFIVVSFCSLPVLNAKTISDTSGIYLTENDFFSNQLKYKSSYPIKEKTGFFWSDFNFDARGIIRLKEDDGGGIKLLSPGAIFGFNKNGIKFIYIKSINKYVSVIYDNGPLYFFAEEQEHAGYKTLLTTEQLLYSNNLTDSMKIFKKENIRKDFANDRKEMQILLALYDQVKTKTYYMKRKQFVQCQKIVKEYMHKLQTTM